MDKKAFDDWSSHAKAIIETTTVNDHETYDEQKKRIAALEADPEAWFRYYFPRYAFADPAPFHLDATQRIIAQPELYEVRMWSRELAKSTRTMMEVLYLTLVGHPPSGGNATRSRKQYVLLVSNSLDNAQRLLMPYRANLEYNKRIIQDYGIQEGATRWQAAEFVTAKGVAFRALGAGQSPRGTRNEEVRPDVMIFDDIDTDADCLNPSIIAQKWRWIEEAVMGTRSISRPTTILFCGNKIAVDCCVVRACAFADKNGVVNIRDDNGVSSWPAKNSEEDIDRVLKQKSYASIQKEYYNNPVVEGAVFGSMAYKPAAELTKYKCLLCYTDPSYTHHGDFKATVLVGYVNNEYHVIKSYVEQTTTARMLDWHREIRQFVGACACEFYMEIVFLQDVIRKEANESLLRSNARVNILGDTRHKQDKYTRIEGLLEPLHRGGRLYLNEAERHSPGMVRLNEQFTAFAPGSSAHDDGPDAVEGAVYLIGEKMRTLRPGAIMMGNPPDKRVNK